MSAGILIVAALMVLSTRVLNEINAELINNASTELAIYTSGRLQALTYIYLATILVSVLSSAFIMVFIGQRVGGPVVAIRAYIAELRKGNYDYGRKLRDGDELIEILEDLKGLAAELKKKNNP
jgi:signal transduction histidine kinase